MLWTRPVLAHIHVLAYRMVVRISVWHNTGVLEALFLSPAAVFFFFFFLELRFEFRPYTSNHSISSFL
jgi:hypothetical protein